MFELNLPIREVIERLRSNGPVDTERISGAAEFGQLPRPMIRQSIVTNLARANQVVKRADGFRNRRVMIFTMQIQQVDIAATEALQAAVHRFYDVLARGAAIVRAVTARTGDLGGQHPAVATLSNQSTDDLLGGAARVSVGGINEVDALFKGFFGDAARGRLVSLRTEHHGAEGQRGHLDAATAEVAIRCHWVLSLV